jgi:hypothetical protein
LAYRKSITTRKRKSILNPTGWDSGDVSCRDHCEATDTPAAWDMEVREAWGKGGVWGSGSLEVAGRDYPAVLGTDVRGVWGKEALEAWGTAELEVWDKAAQEAWDKDCISIYRSRFAGLPSYHSSLALVQPSRSAEQMPDHFAGRLPRLPRHFA